MAARGEGRGESVERGGKRGGGIKTWNKIVANKTGLYFKSENIGPVGPSART